MFQGRTRSQIINKFHKEEKEHPDLIEKSLMSHKKCDSKLLTRYNEFLQNAQKQARESQDLMSKSQNPASKRKRCESMDSTDQTIYEELSKCITKGIRELSGRSRLCV
jgi:ribosomal protein S4